MPGDQMFLCSIPVFANIVTILTGMANSLGGEGRVIYVWEIFIKIIETDSCRLVVTAFSNTEMSQLFPFES